MPRACRWIALLCALAPGLLLPDTSQARTAPADELKKQQIDYAKQLYEQALAAMEGENFDEALHLFEEAYRYAPELHLFNYNIGSAAEKAGNCPKARIAYQRFLDLVPKHQERKAVAAKVEKLVAECPYDAEALEAVSTEGRKDRDEQRAAEEKVRSLDDAVQELQKSIDLYQKVLIHHPKAPAFGAVLRKKKRHLGRLLKLYGSHGLTTPEREKPEMVAPDSVAAACAKAAAQEKRNAAAFEAVLQHFDSREMYRVMTRFHRQAERRDRPRFQQCS